MSRFLLMRIFRKVGGGDNGSRSVQSVRMGGWAGLPLGLNRPAQPITVSSPAGPWISRRKWLGAQTTRSPALEMGGVYLQI